MSKVKLSEIGTFKNGLNFSAEKVLSGCKMIGVPDFGDNYLAKLDGLKEVDEDIVSTDYLLQDNDILFVRSNGNKNLVGRAMLIEKIKEKVTFSGFCIRFRITNNNVNPLYMLYLFKSPLFRKLFSNTQQTSISNLNQEILENIEVELPTIGQQNRIVKVIHGITRKIENNKRINDNLEQQMHLIFENMMAKAATHKLSGKYTIAQNLATAVTGKEDANFSVPNGKYKFFTCSNTPLSCDEYAFDASSILIAGNGDFNVKHYSGKFNAYQRTYILTPDKKYFGLLYLASLYRINSFKSRSSGSIVKFITKSDVENIPVFIPNDRFYLQELNKLIYLQEQNELENELLVNLRDWLLPMLMNGQATISD